MQKKNRSSILHLRESYAPRSPPTNRKRKKVIDTRWRKGTGEGRALMGCTKRAYTCRNKKCLQNCFTAKCRCSSGRDARDWDPSEGKTADSRPHRHKIASRLHSSTFHQTCKTCKNCTTPSISPRLSQENPSPWQPEHFAIDQLCSRAASEQP